MCASLDRDTPAKTPAPAIGAQIKMAGGFAHVPQRAMDIGAEVVQIFDSNARTWKPKPYVPEEIEALRQGLAEHGMPLFFHTIYLINLATPDPELRAKSSAALAEALFSGAVARGAGVVVHAGSHRGEGFAAALSWVGEAVRAARSLAREKLLELSLDLPLPELLFESSAGSGNTLGRDLSELEAMIAECRPGCGLCLDTAHMFAAGSAIHTPEGLDSLVADLDSRSLLPLLRLIHLNDSRTGLASGRDHHENLGDGRIGFKALRRVVRHPSFRHVPFVLEVPGADGHGPDALSVRLAKSMRAVAPDRPGGLVPPA